MSGKNKPVSVGEEVEEQRNFAIGGGPSSALESRSQSKVQIPNPTQRKGAASVDRARRMTSADLVADPQPPTDHPRVLLRTSTSPLSSPRPSSSRKAKTAWSPHSSLPRVPRTARVSPTPLGARGAQSTPPPARPQLLIQICSSGRRGVATRAFSRMVRPFSIEYKAGREGKRKAEASRTLSPRGHHVSTCFIGSAGHRLGSHWLLAQGPIGRPDFPSPAPMCRVGPHSAVIGPIASSIGLENALDTWFFSCPATSLSLSITAFLGQKGLQGKGGRGKKKKLSRKHKQWDEWEQMCSHSDLRSF